MSANRIQFIGTTAEVAEVMSILRVWQLPAGERGFRRRFCPTPIGGILGLHRICAELSSVFDVVLPGQNFVFAPCAVRTGFFILREKERYEEDTLYYSGKGFGDS